MKLVLEIISGAIIGIVGTILIWVLNIEVTAVQSGILIGGLSAMAPERRGEIVTLGLRSILSGTMATCASGALVGLIG